MANPNTKRVPRISATVERLKRSSTALHDSIGHWNPEIAAALYTAEQAFVRTANLIKALPPEWVPPKRPSVRAYTTLKVGDHVRVTERAEKHTPETLHKCALEIVAIEGELAQVKKDNVVYAVKRSILKLAE